MNKKTESDFYYPILLSLKCFNGKANKEEISAATQILLRASKEYVETASGPKTLETKFMKDLNWAGNRMGHAGLLKKVRGSHWELTPLGISKQFTEEELKDFIFSNGRKSRKATK